MKSIINNLKGLAALAITVLTVGCASDLHEKQNLAAAAGFKSITPTKADQQAILASLPADKVTPITYQGKSYYVLPDKAHNQAWVGGPQQYQSYKQLRLAQKLSNENLQAAQMNAMASQNWGAWGGWGGWGDYGWY